MIVSVVNMGIYVIFGGGLILNVILFFVYFYLVCFDIFMRKVEENRNLIEFFYCLMGFCFDYFCCDGMEEFLVYYYDLFSF